MTRTESTVVSVDGHTITLTSLDKVMYPESGTTKAQVLDYYARVSEAFVRHAANRPATRKRWVHGVGTADDPGPMFFQKNLDSHTPSWVQRRTIQHSEHPSDYPLVNDRATLTWLAQMAALEIHVPQWQFGRTGARRNPDRLVLDLDPGEGAGLAECAEVARFARAILADMGLSPMPVTSGSKGIHLYAPLDGKQDAETVSAVAHELARSLEADHPALIVSDMKKTLRGGKVLVDWSQNNGNKTTIAPYSLRGRLRPTVAAPRTWDELENADLAQLDYAEVLERLERSGDPLAVIAQSQHSSLEPTPERMAGFTSSPAARDRLEKYRSMRDGSRTPEPVPDAGHGGESSRGAQPDSAGQPGQADDATFVIQEHHARRLHFDFRLEHDGVLVSWALPKGVPTDWRKNHLAVQTEDHPLEYGTFEGTIPAGEYGAGDVTIWDSGTFELEKWREGKEVIVTLHGDRGSARYALIHTGSADENTWLIHLMKPDARSGAAALGNAVTRPEAGSNDGAENNTGQGLTPAANTERSRGRKTVGAARGGSSVVRPMLATADALADLNDPGEWSFELKWDGIRAIATVKDAEVRLTSRNGIDLTTAYPELAAIALALPGGGILDGEIVALDSRGRPDFGLLQSRMNLTKDREIAAAMASTPVRFIAFDLLEHGGTSALSEPWSTRRGILARILTPQKTVELSPIIDGDLSAAIAASRDLGLEGVMAKRRDSSYTPGRRSRSWLKIKNHRTQEVVIGGWRPGKGRRADQIGSLLLGIPGNGGITYVGRVGTGFADRELDSIRARLDRLARKTSPLVGVPREDAADARWVTPRLVGEVEFAEWTHTGRLRQPSWRGWRFDKEPSDVERENL